MTVTPVRYRRPELDRMPHTVYEFYDAEDRPLYVGCTVHLANRLQAHTSKHYWRDVKAIHCTVYPDAFEGYRVERELIQELQPFYNIQSTEIGSERARDAHRRRRARAAEEAAS